MKTAKFKSLGLEVNLEVPASVEEFDTNAKRTGACLDEAINNVVYRGSLAELRDLFLHGREADKETGATAFDGIEQKTKIERKTRDTGRKDKDGNAILTFGETEAEYFDRVCATQKVEPSSFQTLMDAAAKLVRFDAAARERKPAAPKKLANKYRETAEAILKGAHLKRFVADVKAALGKEFKATGDKAKDAEALGWLVKEFADYKERQTLASMVG